VRGICAEYCPNDWAQYAGHSGGLVVSYDSASQEISVNGRAAAPTGVEGMGSHTTAWLVEVEALKTLIKNAADPLAALWDEVTDDLSSEVMELDAFLPGDQLTAGQVFDILDAAQDVADATSVPDGARCYLEFRNLLPFATVDAGDRAGKGEALGTLSGTFDKESVQHAAGLQATAFSTGPLDCVKALEQAAAELADYIPDLLKKTGKKDSDGRPTRSARQPRHQLSACANSRGS
jgi:hypothetical protein